MGSSSFEDKMPVKSLAWPLALSLVTTAWGDHREAESLSGLGRVESGV